jgi:hypothetical protein
MTGSNVNGVIEVRLDVTLNDYAPDTVRDFLIRLGQILRYEFDADDTEVHELTGITAYPSAGGEVVDEIRGENY